MFSLFLPKSSLLFILSYFSLFFHVVACDDFIFILFYEQSFLTCWSLKLFRGVMIENRLTQSTLTYLDWVQINENFMGWVGSWIHLKNDMTIRTSLCYLWDQSHAQEATKDTFTLELFPYSSVGELMEFDIRSSIFRLLDI